MNLIVMLTNHDVTVPNAMEVFNACADLPVQHWGFKDVGLPEDQMKALVKRMKECGKTTYLEVVTYTEEACLRGAKLAIECGFDYLMGTLYFPSVGKLFENCDTKYLPFCGKVWGSPSVLGESIEGIVDDAKRLATLEGVTGMDLLAYRFPGDVPALIRKYFEEIKVPSVIAGSIDSNQRLDFMKEVQPWGFTIGSAFFASKFKADASVRENIEAVVEYLAK